MRPLGRNQSKFEIVCKFLSGDFDIFAKIAVVVNTSTVCLQSSQLRGVSFAMFEGECVVTTWTILDG
jgi:hypothetical protein